MKEIDEKIAFSYDIKRILKGINSFDYNYGVELDDNIIENIRSDFEYGVRKIFKNDIAIISEEEMLGINKLVSGDYPHCHIR